ncbi:MAG: hypothetical protein AB7O43_10535 [Hyphomicrobiaceae bacterium]
MSSLLCRVLLLAVAGATTLSPGAHAQGNFYQGKELTILANFALGGPTFSEARLLARHLPRVIRGNPAVIVRQMDGDNGRLGANWLATEAPPDGLMLGYLTRTAGQAALGDPKLSPKIASLEFVASRLGLAVAFASTKTGIGLKRPADLLRQKKFRVGGLTADDDLDIRLRMQLDLLGADYSYLPGFSGTTEARLAFQRGNVHVLAEMLPSYTAGIERSWVGSGRAIPLWFDPIDDGTAFTRSDRADGIAALTFTDFMFARTGALPNSDLFPAWRLINQVGTRFLRIIALAPGSPREAADEMRSAIGTLAQDADFREDALKSLRFVPEFATDQRTGGLLREVLSPPSRIRAILRSYAESNGPESHRAPSAN